MTNFSPFLARKLLAAGFEERVYQLLRCTPGIVSVGRNGSENTHADFIESIRHNESPEAAALRFAPDGIASTDTGSVFYWEAKAGRNIEKLAYTNYMRAGQIIPVFIFVRAHPHIMVSNIRRVRLIPGEETVGRFRPEDRFPVVDGWVVPRLAGVMSSTTMSGTPYREIDASSMDVFDQTRFWDSNNAGRASLSSPSSLAGAAGTAL